MKSNLLRHAVASTIILSVLICTGNVWADCVPAPTGLVGWWKGEANSTDALGTNNGTTVGNAGYGPGTAGLSFTFDGNGDAVQLGNPAILQLQNFTIEGWIRRASSSVSSLATPDAFLFGYGQSGYGFGIFDNGALFLTHVDVDNVSTSTGFVSDTNWHHVAVTKSGGIVTFFRDGIASNTLAYNPTFTFSTTITIGARGDNLNNGFFGSIDELSVYNRALFQSEIQAIYNSGASGKCSTPTAPFIYTQPASQTVVVSNNVSFSVLAGGTAPLLYQWRFNGTNILSATNTTLSLTNVQPAQSGDYSVMISNSVNATISSNATLVVNPGSCVLAPAGLVGWWKAEGDSLDQVGTDSGVLVGNAVFGTGIVGQCFSFDGSGDGVQLGNSANFQFQDFTIEAWIRRTSSSVSSLVTPDALLFGYGAGGYGFGIFDNGALYLTRVNVNSVSSPIGFLSDTNWHHVAVTKSNNVVTFYRDGISSVAPPYNSTFTFSSSVAIGARGDNLNNGFYGSIDELAVYSRALTLQEIQSIYSSAYAGKCLQIAPSITSQPTNQTVAAGTNLTLLVSAVGSQPLTYQWKFNGTNISNATNATLVLTNVIPTNSGSYSVGLTNAYGFALSSNVTIKVSLVFAFGNNVPLPQPVATFTNSVTIKLQNSYTNGSIFYTLDGSQPTFASTPYSNPFVLDQSAVLRALGFSPDFTISNETDPFNIVIVPTYRLTVTNPGGGNVNVVPLLAQYPSNTTVNLTALPAGGWTFLKWLGNAAGTNASTSIIMNGNKQVQPVFGTTLNTTVTGSGSVLIQPSGGTYPYGTVVTLSAIPLPGYYFGVWGNAASGSTNPLPFVLKTAHPTVSSLFVAASGSQASLSVIPQGSGTVDLNPRTNVFNLGDNVMLTATPGSGQSFNGWSGDISSTQNPVNVTMNQSKVIYANFTHRLQLSGPTADGNGFGFTISGDSGARFQIDRSTNLLDWVTLSVLTNTYGTAQFFDTGATNSSKGFYRSLMLLP